MKTVTTLEQLNELPPRSIIVGPSWDDEVYQKVDNVDWFAPGNDVPWDSESLEHRGPFAVLREGELMDDEIRPIILEGGRPSETLRFPLRVTAFPIGQVEVKPDGNVLLHYSRDDVIMGVRNAIQDRE